jgi:hypothetical protein
MLNPAIVEQLTQDLKESATARIPSVMKVNLPMATLLMLMRVEEKINTLLQDKPAEGMLNPFSGGYNYAEVMDNLEYVDGKLVKKESKPLTLDQLKEQAGELGFFLMPKKKAKEE